MSQSSHTTEREQSSAITPRNRSPFRFFLLVFALSIPLWLIGTLTTFQILPGLPVSSIMIIVPTLAALILVYRENRGRGVSNLLKRSYDFKRISAKVWFIPIFLLMPGVMALSFVLMRLMGSPVPPPQFSLLTALVLFVTFFIAGLGEEIGWMGYAYDPLEERSNALQAGILLGLISATWHIVPLLQVNRSPAWIAWWYLYTVSLHVLTVWIYNNTSKSVFATAVIHSMINLSWQLFPINGSYFDPQITGLIVAFAAVIVTIIWGPKTLIGQSPGQGQTGAGEI